MPKCLVVEGKKKSQSPKPKISSEEIMGGFCSTLLGASDDKSPLVGSSDSESKRSVAGTSTVKDTPVSHKTASKDVPEEEVAQPTSQPPVQPPDNDATPDPASPPPPPRDEEEAKALAIKKAQQDTKKREAKCEWSLLLEPTNFHYFVIAPSR